MKFETYELTDAQETAILNIQEHDGDTLAKVFEHVVTLGINARLNSINAGKKRAAADAALEAQAKFANACRIDPTIVTDPARMVAIMRECGVITPAATGKAHKAA